jgi:hypothetical protein
LPLAGNRRNIDDRAAAVGRISLPACGHGESTDEIDVGTLRNSSTLVSKKGTSRAMPAMTGRGPARSLPRPSRPAITLASLATSMRTYFVALARSGSNSARAPEPGVRQIGNHDFPAVSEQGPGGRKVIPEAHR